jgi:hypothetical protein
MLYLYVHVYHVLTYVRTYVRTYNVMSQLSDWKRAHMCTENHVCFGRIHGSQLREGANAGTYVRTYTYTNMVHSYCAYHGTMVWS